MKDLVYKNNKKVIILGGGPNRIGQGIEFDYCCCHAAYALKEIGYEAIIINSNPETVSTDYKTSDKLFFEPITNEDVMSIIEQEKPFGVIVQLGGQTPLNLAKVLEENGVRILGTSFDSIDRAEDRERFKEILDKLNLRQPENGIAFNLKEAKLIADKIGYPVLLRPSYVLGGRAMEIVYNEMELETYMIKATFVSDKHPILIDSFLEDAIEIDVDMISDGEDFVIAGIMEHIEEAGIHSGDSAMVLPTYSISKELLNEIRISTKALAKELNVKGLMNIQYAIKDNILYVLEVNPRASRTIPFISKAIGVSLPKFATKIMLGEKLKNLGFLEEKIPNYFCVKESVFPFSRFPGAYIVLGPEMRSTGEVMGIDKDYGMAFAKAQIAAGQNLPVAGGAFLSVKDHDKKLVFSIAKRLFDMGFKLYATEGTSKILIKANLPVISLSKIDGTRPNILDLIKNNEIQLIINTASGSNPQKDQNVIRNLAIMNEIPLITTISGAKAVVNGIKAIKNDKYCVKSLQEYYNGRNKELI